MKARNLIILLVVAVVLCVVALMMVNQSDQAVSGETEWREKPLLADLEKKVTDVVRIELDRPAGKIVLAKSKEGEWNIESNGGYPAQLNNVQSLLVNLLGLKAAERITDKKEKYETFGVAGETGKEGKIRLFAGGDKPLAEVILGNARESADEKSYATGHFLRIANSPWVYLSKDDSIWFSEPSTRSWVDPEILNVEEGKIVDVAVDHATTSSLHLAWNDGLLALQNPPAGKQGKDSEVRMVRGALSNLSLDDVLPADSDAVKGLDATTTFTAQSKDGTRYLMGLADKNTKKYLKIRTSYTEPFLTDDDKATTTSMANAEAAAKAAKESVDKNNANFAKWVYVIPEYQYDRLTPKMAKIAEPIPPKAKEAKPAVGAKPAAAAGSKKK